MTRRLVLLKCDCLLFAIVGLCEIAAQRTEVPEGGTMTLDCRPQWQHDAYARWHMLKPYKSQIMYYIRDSGVNVVTPGTNYTSRIDPDTLGVCIINDVQKDDSDEFECEVETVPFGTTKKFSYSIVARPTKPPIVPETQQRVLLGQGKVLTCHLDEDTKGQVFYSWSRTTGEVTGQVNSTTGTLTFESTVADDQDTYTCRASNIAGHTENTVQLFVDYQPSSFTLTGYTPPGPLYSGDQQEMICQTRGGRPLPVLSWQCVQQTGTSTTQDDIVTSRFTATVTSGWDGEQCRCTATQAEAGITDDRMVTFNVYYK